MDYYEWEAERRAMETLDASLTGRHITVMDVGPESPGALGYTSKDNAIHVARDHPLYRSLNDNDAKAFRYGVNVHECMHQIYTDFDYMDEMLAECSGQAEKKIFMEIANLIEDPAIENFAPQAVGGYALDALYYTIETIYEQAQETPDLSDKIGKKAAAFHEYLEALIQFGDRGLVKGGFKSKIALYYFNKTAPAIYEAINEPDGKRRIDLSWQVTQMTRPLWHDVVSKDLSEVMSSIGSKYAKKPSQGNGSGTVADPCMDNRNKGREQSLKKCKKEEEEDLKRDASLSDGNGGGNEKNDGSPCGNACADEPDDAGKGNANQDGRKKQPEESGNDGDCTETDENREAGGTGNQQGDSGIYTPIHPYDPDIGEKISEMLKKFTENKSAQDQRERAKQENKGIKDKLKSENRQFENVIEKNMVMNSNGMENAYNEVLELITPILKPAIAQLKKLFIEDKSTKSYALSGKASMKRFASGRVTARMFERRTLQGDRQDIAAFLLFDMSGSMAGDKEISAKITAILFSELFGYFNIPVYCMSFQTAEGADALQIHYCTWSNERGERMGILKAKADGSNFDSYSIRYSTELLRRRKEKHKLLCVISDGKPAHYFSDARGIRENKAAIDDAKHSGINVFGIGIGNISTQAFETMYNKDYFIKVQNSGDLADQMTGLIKNLVKGW